MHLNDQHDKLLYALCVIYSSANIITFEDVLFSEQPVKNM